MIKIYCARGMSGRPKPEVIKEATKDSKFLRAAGFHVSCPVEAEGIKGAGVINASKDEIAEHWKRDKKLIRESHVLFHMSPHLNSAGSWQEVGYKRYHMQGPVVHVYPLGKLPPPGAIPRLENDYVCDSLEEAIEYTLRAHGTFWRRTKWRLDKLNKSLLKSVWYQSKEWIK
jgi:hypothetical protein